MIMVTHQWMIHLAPGQWNNMRGKFIVKRYFLEHHNIHDCYIGLKLRPYPYLTNNK